MDFDKTSFSVDWFTPGEKYAPKRLSFPKSARISIDDFVSDSPLGFCFSPVDEAIPRPNTYSFVDTPFEKAFGWTNSAPQSPLVPSCREPQPMSVQDSRPSEESITGGRALALSIADEFALCGVDLDVSCLDALDEQLLLAPLESFSEQCWAAAVHEDVTAATLPRRNTRSRARSFKCDRPRAVPSPMAREYPGSFERIRPLATKITLPHEKSPHYLSTPSSDSLDASLMPQEQPLEYILYTDPEGRPFAIPAHTPRRSKKRELILTQSFESLPPSPPPKPPKSHLQPSKSANTLRIISDAYTTMTRGRRKSPL